MSNFHPYIKDKCNAPIDMGKALVFANPMPGMNDIVVRPFGWSEYESAYRHQYVPDPCPPARPCVDVCRPKGTERKPPLKEFLDPNRCSTRPGICNLCHMVKCRCPIAAPWDELKEKVVIYDPDSVRNLIVRGELKNVHPLVLSCQHYDNILNTSIKKPKEEREADQMEELRMKEMARMECKEQADELRLMDEYRLRDAMSPEAREDMKETVCRAATILKEDEPEVRAINKVILATKVQAIREAQLAEKELIKCEQAEEDLRILAVTAQDKAYVLIPDVEEKEVELVEQKKRNFMVDLHLQIQEKEAYKFLEKEMLEIERAGMRKAWEEADLKDIQLAALKIEKKHNFGTELLNDQLLHLSLQRQHKEFENAEDQKMVEWQKRKAAEDEQHEKDKAAKMKLKQLEAIQMFDTQKRASGDKGLKDDMKTKRHVENQEREWRKKEREVVLKREHNSKALKDGILRQIQEKQQFFCEQAVFDKAMYDKIFNFQDELMEEERKKVDERNVRNARHRYDLREQIHNFQMRKVQERKNHFIEGINIRREIEKRDVEIRCTMESKMDQLRDSNLPHKYINYIRKAVDEELKPGWQKSMSKI